MKQSAVIEILLLIGLKIKLNTANLNFLIYNNCNKYWHLDVCLS